MIIEKDKVSKNTLILFVKATCEYCTHAVKILSVIDEIDLLIYEAFPSRIEGKIEIRHRGGKSAGLPLLLDAKEIITIPMLYDPQLDQKISGIAEIEKYLMDSGLVGKDEE